MSILQRVARPRKSRSTLRFELLLGPAGSGKTQAVAERVLRLVRAHRRVLAILPTETARARVEEHVYDSLPLGRGLAGLELHTPLSLNGLIANDFGHLRGRWRSRTVLHSLASQAAFLHANINHLPLDRLRPKQGLHDAMLSLASFFSRVQDVGITPHDYLDLVQHHLPHWTEEARQLELEKAMCYEAYQRLKLERDCMDRHDQGLLALELLARHRDEVIPPLQERHSFLVLDDLQSLPPVTVRLAVGIAGRGVDWGPPPLPPPSLPLASTTSTMSPPSPSGAAGARELLSAAAFTEGEWGGGGHVVDSTDLDTVNGATVGIQQQQQQQQQKAQKKKKELKVLATGDPVQILGRLARDLPSWSSLHTPHEHRHTTSTTNNPPTSGIDTDSTLRSAFQGTLMRYDGLSMFRAAFPDAVVTHLPPPSPTTPTRFITPSASMLSSTAAQNAASTGTGAGGTAAAWGAETDAALMERPSAPSQVDLTASSSPVDATTPSTPSATHFPPPSSPSSTAARSSVLYPGLDVEGDGTGFGVEAVWSVGLHDARVHVGKALARGDQATSGADQAVVKGKKRRGGDGDIGGAGGGGVEGGRAVTAGADAPAVGMTDHHEDDGHGGVRSGGLVEAWAFADEMSALRGLAQAIKQDREANRRVLVVCCKTSSIWALQAVLEEAGLEPRVTGLYSMHGGPGTGSPLHHPLSRVMMSLLTALSTPLDTHASATAIYDVLMHALGARSDTPEDAHVVSRLLERCRTRHEDLWSTLQKHDGTSDALKKFVSDFEELQTQAHTQPASHLVMQYLQRSGELSSKEDSKGSKGKKNKNKKLKSLLTTRTTTTSSSKRDHLSSYGDITCGGDVEAADALAGFLHALVQIEEVAPDPRVSSVLPTLLLSRDYNDTSVIPSDDVDPASSTLLLCPWSRASVLEAPYDRIHITYATSTRLPSSRGYSSSSSSRIGGGGRLLLPPRIGLAVEPATVVGSAKDWGYDVDLRVLERLLARLPPSQPHHDDDSSSSRPGMVLSYSRRASGGVREQRPTPLLGDLGMHVVLKSTKASGGSSSSSSRKGKGGVPVRRGPRVDPMEEVVVDVGQDERGSVSIRRAHMDAGEKGNAKVETQPPLFLSTPESTISASAADTPAPTSVEGESSSSSSSPQSPSSFTDSISASLPSPPPAPSDPSAAPLRLSYSSIYTYRTCPLSYYYAHVLHLSPPTTESSVRMLYGRALHAAAHETMRYLQQEYAQHVLADDKGRDGGGRGGGERKGRRTTMPVNRAKMMNLVQGRFREEWSRGTVSFNSRSHEESLLDDGLAAVAAIVDRSIIPPTDAEEGMAWRYPWWREGHGAASTDSRVRVPALLERRFEVSIPLRTSPHHTHTANGGIHPPNSVVLSGVLDRVDVVCPPGAPVALPHLTTTSPPPLPSSKFVIQRGQRDDDDHHPRHHHQQQQHAHVQRGLDGDSSPSLLSLQDNDDKAELWVVEYKSRVGAVRDVGALARGSFQLGLYSHAVERLTGKRPTKLFIESMEDGRVGEAGEGVYEEAREVLAAAAQGVAQKDFRAAPAFHKCRTCAFISVCPHAATRSHAGAVPDTIS